MKKLNKIAFLAIGVVLGMLITMVPMVASASTGTATMQVTYSNIKLFVDGSLITPKDANGNVVEPFISNGTTYLPVRALAAALGKDVTWDGSTSSVYIGKVPGKVTYMFDELKAYESSNWQENQSVMFRGTTYVHGVSFGGGYASYALNGNYTTISGTLGRPDGKDPGASTLSVFLDGTLYKEYNLNTDMMPTDITIDVSGVQTLKFTTTGDMQGGAYGFGNVTIQ